MKLACFYYPKLTKDNEIIKEDKVIREFELNDKIPTKTLYYNYGEDFVIYQDEELFRVEGGILKERIYKENLEFPINIVFGKGRQLTITEKKDLSNIRMLLKGDFEKEKEIGELFYLIMLIKYKIKIEQYEVMLKLTNSSRDYIYINSEIEQKTKPLLDDLELVESKLSKMIKEDKNIKDSYLQYMNFNKEEDLFDICISKYFNENSKGYKRYKEFNKIYDYKEVNPEKDLEKILKSYE